MPDARRLALVAPVLLVVACASSGGQAGTPTDSATGTASGTSSPSSSSSPSGTKTRTLNAACAKPTAEDAKAVTGALTKGAATDGYAVKSKTTKGLTFISFYVDGANPARSGKAIGVWAISDGKVYNATAYTRTLSPSLRYVGKAKAKALKGALTDKAAQVASGCTQLSHGS